MKGVIFNLFEKYIDKSFGELSFQGLLEENKELSATHFIGPQLYPDKDFMSLFLQAVQKYKLGPEKAQFGFGEFCYPVLKSKVTDLIKNINCFKDLIHSVDNIIHVEVAKLYPGAETPKIICTDISKDEIQVDYISKRNLSFFMEGLMTAAAKDFDESISIQRVERKEVSCSFLIRINN